MTDRRPAAFSGLLSVLATLALTGCALFGDKPLPESIAPVAPSAMIKPRVALALSGGAARGFAHVGVIKALEAQGIVPDIIVGTSAGAVVGALYAAGYSGFDLQQLAMRLNESAITDWALPDRGFLRGEYLQKFINDAVQQRPIEKLNRPFAAIAADLKSGDPIVFRTGNVGMAVRASSAVPGIFQPVAINGHEYVDGGLVSPVPVATAHSLGAQVVIAVDISGAPASDRTHSTPDVLLQSFSIMMRSIGRHELKGADVVIRPNTAHIGFNDFQAKYLAILEGEKAVIAVLPQIRAKLQPTPAR